MSDFLEIDITFTDLSVIESDGFFEDLDKIMVSEFPHSKDWCVSTSAMIESQFGTGGMVLEMKSDRNIYIVDFFPSIGDVFYNPDIQAMSVWSHERGWKSISPSMILVKGDIEFWKHFWETHLVESEYLEEIFGAREIDYSDDENDEEDYPGFDYRGIIDNIK